LVKVLPTAIVALVVGAIAAGVAFRQYRVAEAKLKLDLFDKRYAIFLETWTILSEVVMKGTREKNWGLATPFNNFMPQASFLFGADVADYLSAASKRWTDLRAFEAEGSTNLTPAQMAQTAELKAWFFRQADVGCKELFGRYLSFERWR